MDLLFYVVWRGAANGTCTRNVTHGQIWTHWDSNPGGFRMRSGCDTTRAGAQDGISRGRRLNPNGSDLLHQPGLARSAVSRHGAAPAWWRRWARKPAVSARVATCDKQSKSSHVAARPAQSVERKALHLVVMGPSPTADSFSWRLCRQLSVPCGSEDIRHGAQRWLAAETLRAGLATTLPPPMRNSQLPIGFQSCRNRAALGIKPRTSRAILIMIACAPRGRRAP